MNWVVVVFYFFMKKILLWIDIECFSYYVNIIMESCIEFIWKDFKLCFYFLIFECCFFFLNIFGNVKIDEI